MAKEDLLCSVLVFAISILFVALLTLASPMFEFGGTVCILASEVSDFIESETFVLLPVTLVTIVVGSILLTSHLLWSVVVEDNLFNFKSDLSARAVSCAGMLKASESVPISSPDLDFVEKNEKDATAAELGPRRDGCTLTAAPGRRLARRLRANRCHQ